ncbi:MAG: hypothetical protein ACK5V3_12710 [Bdellovibrionales bacterium]
MLKSTLLLISLYFVSLAHSNGKVVIESAPGTHSVLKGSSEYHRMGDKVNFNVNVGGLGPGYSRNQGLSTGIYLSDDSLILVDVTSGRGFASRSYTSSDGTTSISGENEVDHLSLGVHYKLFTGNSFYVRSGVDLMNIKYRYDYNSPFGNSYNSRFDANVLFGQVAIGNQWQVDNLTIGCDWVGLAVPLVTQLDNKSIQGNFDNFDREDLNEDINLYTKISSLLLLRLYVGGSF